MKNKFTTSALLIIGAIFISGCATYHMSTQSLLEQFASSGTEKKGSIWQGGLLYFPGRVTGNDLKEVKVLDKDGQEHIIPVNNRTGIRIYKKDGTKTTFYFDTVLIKDSTINGSKTHFFGGLSIHPINLNNIEKIELQR